MREPPRSIGLCVALAIGLAVALTPAAFAASSDPSATTTIGPVPDWVVEEADSALHAPAAAAKDAEAYLLVDEQVNVSSAERYCRSVTVTRTAEAVRECSTVTVDYDPSYERLVFHRVDVIRDGKRSSRLSRGSIQVLRREAGLESQVLDGTLTATLVLQDVRPGDRLDVAYTLRGFNPIFGGRYEDSFTGGWSHPVGRVQVRILAPASRPLRFAAFGGAREPGSTVRGSTVEYLWELVDTPPVPSEDMTPSWHVAAPWLEVSEFGDWAEVGRWALSLFTPARLPPELEELAAGWRKRYASPEERVLAAVDWVQRNIRYVGIELGAGSYRPSPPATVAGRRFGDCKDQVHLLCALLRRMDVEAAPVMVSTWGPKLVSQLIPSSLPFNHVIARVMLKGRAVLVDPTSQSQRGPLAERFVPDYGHGLLVADGQAGLIPIGPYQGVAPEVEVVERLRAGGRGDPAEMTVETTARGGAADDIRWHFASSRLEEVASSYLNYYASRYPGIESAGDLVSQDDEKANVFTTTEHYRIPEFWVKDDGGSCAEVLADAISEVIPKSKTRVRTTPLWVDFPRRVVQRMEVELPEDWPDHLETETFSNAAFQLRVDQAVSGRLAKISWDYRALAEEVSVAQVADVQKSIKELEPSLSFQFTWGAEAESAGTSSTVLAVGLGVLAAALAAGILAYRRAARPAGPSPAVPVVPMMRVGDVAPQGLGGWLVLVVVGLFARPIVSATSIAQLGPALSADGWARLTDPAGAAYHPLWGPLLLFEVGANVVLGIAAVLLIVLLFERRRAFPRGYAALLVAQVAVTLVDLAGTGVMPGGETSALTTQTRTAVSLVISSVVWMLYILRSRRVKLTFVR